MKFEAETNTRRTIRQLGLAAAAMLALGLAALAEAPAHAADTVAANIVNVVYACEDGVQFDATFDNDADTLTIVLSGSAPLVMTPAVSGSGFRFVKDGYEVHGKGPNALLTRPGAAQTNCSAQ